MRRLLVVFIVALFATAAFAEDRAAEVRAAETAFAKAFADRDQAKFATFLAPDAHFLGGKRTMNNAAEVLEGWSGLLKSEKPPFSWSPDRVVVNAAGDLGLSTGPVLDPTGKHIANYTSMWQRQKDGSWKVVFDGPGAEVCEAK